MSEETTARLALPLMQPGQAQKEMTHNEALALLDLAVQPVVLAMGRDVPPTDPGLGDAWIVGAAPSGAWSGQAQRIAGWTAGGWRFVAPRPGMTAFVTAEGASARFGDGTWALGPVRAAAIVLGGDRVLGVRQAAIASPSTGGGVTDIAARTAIDAILGAMRAHGLIAG